MAPTTRRSPNATLVTQSAIDEASNALQDLPEKPRDKLSLREAVETLREPIVAALEKGYSYEDITAMLANQGVTIAPSSLKHYLARSNRQLKAKGAGTQTRRKRTVRQTEEDEIEPDELELQSAPAPVEPAEAAPKRGRRAAKADTAESTPPAPPEMVEEKPKRGRGSSGKSSPKASESKPRTTTRSARTKSTTAASTRKRRG